MSVHQSLKDKRAGGRKSKFHPGQKASQERKRENQEENSRDLKQKAKRSGISVFELISKGFQEVREIQVKCPRISYQSLPAGYRPVESNTLTSYYQYV